MDDIGFIERDFSERYSGTVGTIDGGDPDLTVRLNIKRVSQDSIFVECLPVDPSKIPPRHAWVIFPKSFRGLPVYYKRGHRAFAQ